MSSTCTAGLGVDGDPGGDDLLNDPGLAQRLARKLPGQLDVDRRLECVQQAILVLLVRLATGRQVSDREAFIVGAARRLACKQLSWPRPRSLEEAFPSNLGPPERHDAQAEEDLMARRLWMECALGQLAPEERQLLLAHLAEDRTLREIARQTGVPQRTVQWRFHRAVERLRAALERLRDD